MHSDGVAAPLSGAAPSVWKRRLLVPEVIQTSAMDCGPAALKAVFAGHGLHLSYDKLREACRTEIDGTSINRIEELATQLGLEARQVLVPPDHLLRGRTDLLPAIALTTLPGGGTHFVTLWRRHGPWTQVMDPARGRRWVRREHLAGELLLHTVRFDPEIFVEWVHSERFLAPLEVNLRGLLRSRTSACELLEGAAGEEGWFTLAALDAAGRMTAALARTGALRGADERRRILRTFFDAARQGSDGWKIIPEPFWFAHPAPDEIGGVSVKGAVIVSFQRPQSAAPEPAAAPGESTERWTLESFLDVRPKPFQDLAELLRDESALVFGSTAFALLLAATIVVLQGFIFRGMLDLLRQASLIERRLGSGLAFSVLLALGLLLEIPIASTILRLGRRLEARLRIRFSVQISQVADRFFQSRPKADLAERAHSIVLLRDFPSFLAQLLRTTFTMLLTFGGIAWLHPPSAAWSLGAALSSVILPMLLQPLLAETDLRIRTYFGAMTSFYLDSMRGLVTVRSYGAESSIRTQHEALLVDWMRASGSVLKLGLLTAGISLAASISLCIWILMRFLLGAGGGADALLFSYWVLSLPRLGQSIADLAMRLPHYSNAARRVMEPFRQQVPPKEPSSTPTVLRASSDGAAITFERVGLALAGKEVLNGVEFHLPPGTKVAVVGGSGAGKTTLLGLLLGWHEPTSGTVKVDGQPLDASAICELRSTTAWIDPSVQLWNRSLWKNLLYGAAREDWMLLPDVLERNAELYRVAAKLPEGVDSRLGESGGRLSGGEAQRVRVARAMLRPGARLALLDEPFRGLEREHRSALLQQALSWWCNATLILVTHDLAETIAFDRVIVMEGGRIVEMGPPRELMERVDSRYRGMVELEREAMQRIQNDPLWKRLWIRRGRFSDTIGGEP